MFKTSSCKSGFLLTALLASTIYGHTPATTNQPDSSTESTNKNRSAEKKSTQEFLKLLISAAFMVSCEEQGIDETRVNVETSGKATSFSSALKGNGIRFFDRVFRLLGITQPTITITSTTTLQNNPEDYEKILFIYTKDHAPFCTLKSDEQGQTTLTCSIMYTMKEYDELKKQFEGQP